MVHICCWCTESFRCHSKKAKHLPKCIKYKEHRRRVAREAAAAAAAVVASDCDAEEHFEELELKALPSSSEYPPNAVSKTEYRRRIDEALKCSGKTAYRCFVGGLSLSTTQKALKDAFLQFGHILDAKVVLDKATGRSRGFGFVSFHDEDAMNAAIEAMDGHDLHGRIITVDKAHICMVILSGSPSAAGSAPSKGMGMKLGKSQKANQFLESLKAEGGMIIEDVRPSANPGRSAAPPSTDPITLTTEEKLHVTLKKDGGVANFDVQGTLSLQVLNQDDGFIQVQIECGDNAEIKFKIHPNINKELFSNESILGSKDPNRPFPAGQSGAGLGLLKWRLQSKDEADVPLTINCWPSVSGNESYVNIEYDASPMFELQNVVISLPLPALREAPNVKQINGEWRYDSRNSILEWSILLIDDANRSGAMEFVVPNADPSAFFPISVRFSAASTFSNMKVVDIIPLKDGAAPKFSHRTQLVTESYQVV